MSKYRPTLEFYSKFELKKMRKVWRWRVKASNGKIIGASSEAYYNKSECMSNAVSLGVFLFEHYSDITNYYDESIQY